MEFKSSLVEPRNQHRKREYTEPEFQIPGAFGHNDESNDEHLPGELHLLVHVEAQKPTHRTCHRFMVSYKCTRTRNLAHYLKCVFMHLGKS